MRYARYLDDELLIEKYVVDVTRKEVYDDEGANFEYGIKIPEKFVPIFQGQQLVVTRGYGRKGHPVIINIFLESAWEEFEEHLNKLPTTSDKRVRRLASFFTGDATDTELTVENKIVMQEHLINIANIDRQCLFLVIHQEDGMRFAVACKDMFDD